MHDDELLTPEEASEVITLAPSTLRKLAWQKKIRCYKVRGALRFKRGDLYEMVKEQPAVRSDVK